MFKAHSRSVTEIHNLEFGALLPQYSLEAEHTLSTLVCSPKNSQGRVSVQIRHEILASSSIAQSA